MREDLEADEPLRQTTALLQVHACTWMLATMCSQDMYSGVKRDHCPAADPDLIIRPQGEIIATQLVSM